MCTVLLRLDAGSAWPVVLGAIRDEFVERSWDPPAHHWTGTWAGFVGGRDRKAGGTWLAVDPSPSRPAVAALLNGLPRDPLPSGSVRPTRGDLVLRMLAHQGLPEGDELAVYDRFHLLMADRDRCQLWTWDGEALTHQVPAGPHNVIGNAGLDAQADPMVPHVAPLLAEAAEPEVDLDAGWGGWTGLLGGDGTPGDDERALLVDKRIDDRRYGSTSAALVGIAADGRLRYDFTPTPADRSSWIRVEVSPP